MSISSLDLNLLLTLHTVLEERSVAQAARRLHVTPSAVSNALARLRDMLSDPLFTRKGRGIVPTPRALELAPVLERVVRDLEAALLHGQFDPAACTRTFTLAVADAGQIAWVPAIARAMGRALPQARLRVVGIDSLVALGDLAAGQVDLHLGMRARGQGIHAETLVKEPLVLVARKEHPALRKRLSHRALGELRHVRVELSPGRGFRDEVATAWERAGIPREVAITVPSFAAAAEVAASSELVATLPKSLLTRLAPRLGLRPLRGPVPAITVEMAMCWHERTHADPAAAAFRALVRRVVVRSGKTGAIRSSDPRRPNSSAESL